MYVHPLFSALPLWHSFPLFELKILVAISSQNFLNLCSIFGPLLLCLVIQKCPGLLRYLLSRDLLCDRSLHFGYLVYIIDNLTSYRLKSIEYLFLFPNRTAFICNIVNRLKSVFWLKFSRLFYFDVIIYLFVFYSLLQIGVRLFLLLFICACGDRRRAL